MNQTRVLLVDDQRMFLDGCQAVLEAEPDIAVVGTAVNAQEALDMTRREHPDVIVMDIEMPDGMNGIAATRCLRMRDPHCRVVLLSQWSQHSHILDGIKAGAIGYVLKDTASVDLVHAIRRAARGERVVAPDVLPKLFDIVSGLPNSPGSVPQPVTNQVVLTERERHLINLIAAGLSNGELCDSLALPEGTLKSSIQKVFIKLGAHSRQEAVEVARKHGLL